MSSSNQKKGGKKCGRNKIKCARYRAEERREKNKARKIAKQNKIQKKAEIKRIKRRDMLNA